MTPISCHLVGAIFVSASLAAILVVYQTLAYRFSIGSAAPDALIKLLILSISSTVVWLILSFVLYYPLAIGCTDGNEGLDGRLIKLTFWLPFSLGLSWVGL